MVPEFSIVKTLEFPSHLLRYNPLEGVGIIDILVCRFQCNSIKQVDRYFPR